MLRIGRRVSWGTGWRRAGRVGATSGCPDNPTPGPCRGLIPAEPRCSTSAPWDSTKSLDTSRNWSEADRIGAEHGSGIPGGHATGRRSVGKERIGLELADTIRAVQLRRLVEWRRLAAVGVTALLFLAPIENAVGARGSPSWVRSYRQSPDAGQNRAYPKESGIGDTAPAYFDVREKRLDR